MLFVIFYILRDVNAKLYMRAYNDVDWFWGTQKVVFRPISGQLSAADTFLISSPTVLCRLCRYSQSLDVAVESSCVSCTMIR